MDESGELLIGANLVDSNSNGLAISNQYGYYSLISSGDFITIKVSYAGYQSQMLKVTAPGGLQNIELKSRILEEVYVTAPVGQTRSDFIQVDAAMLKSIPTIGGIPDVIKGLSFYPGISTGVEGTTALFVRGGGPSENLFLLDDAPVYNTSHLFGFVSIFNPDVVKSIDVYKQNFPVRYGGRLSSVIDVRMKDGNKLKRKGEFGIGLLESRFTLEGPLSKKTTYIIATRASYLDIIQLPQTISFNRGNVEDFVRYRLFDINAKLNTTLNSKSKLSVSLNTSHDGYKAINSAIGTYQQSILNVKWSNQTATVRYKRLFNNNLFGNIVGVYSRYKKTVNVEEKLGDISEIIKTYSTIEDYTIKGYFEWQPIKSNEFQFGFETTQYSFIPNYIETTRLSASYDKINTFNTAIYLQDKWTLNNAINFQVGLRGVAYYPSGSPYLYVEPRATVELKVPSVGRFSLGYTKMNQNIHLLSSNNGIELTSNIWVPATDSFKPSFSDQFSIGWNKEIISPHMFLNLGLFYKKRGNLITYKSGKSFFQTINKSWEDLLEGGGIGKAYGVEVSIKKTKGKFTGILAYTWSRTFEKFKAFTNDQWVPARFDKPNNFSITGKYKLSKEWSCFSSFVYSTGTPTQLPVAIITDIQGNKRPIYTNVDTQRSPDYHRLDIGFSRTKILNDKERTLSFGIYNVYNRTNPFYLDYFFDDQLSRGVITSQGAFPALPYISYSIKF